MAVETFPLMELHTKSRLQNEANLKRFLGVFINFGANRKILVKKLRGIARNATIILYRKRLTIDHLRYIFNRGLVPKLEYLMQTCILTAGL